MYFSIFSCYRVAYVTYQPSFAMEGEGPDLHSNEGYYLNTYKGTKAN